MSTSTVLCQNLVCSSKSKPKSSFQRCILASSVIQSSCGRAKARGMILNAKKRHTKRKKSWWQRFLFDDDGNWLGLKDEDAFDVLESEEDSSDDELSEYERFEAWKSRAEAMVDLRDAREDVKNEESRRWEDWLVDGTSNDSDQGMDWAERSLDSIGKQRNDVGEELSKLYFRGGLVKLMRDLILQGGDDDILYEDRIFRYASYNSVSDFEECNLNLFSYSNVPFLNRFCFLIVIVYFSVSITILSQLLQLMEEHFDKSS